MNDIETPGGSEALAAIGDRLRLLRKQHALSQREVAEAIGLPQSNLSRIENGKQRLNLTVLARILGIYQTSIQDFFAREDEARRSGEAVSSRERQLVESFRRLTPEDRREVEAFVDYRLFRARRDRAVGDFSQD
jgi:transcriptional regulator with XRE-family HTH domain